MGYRSDALRRSAAILVLAVNILALGACSNSSFGSMAPTVVQKAAITPDWITVDDACNGTGTGTCANEVSGINDSRDIVGNYSNCTVGGSNPTCSSKDWSCAGTTMCQPCPLIGGAVSWSSYTSTYNNGYTSFKRAQYPDVTDGQYMSAISDRVTGSGSPPAIEVGCINSFSGGGTEEKGIWGLLNNNGLWSVHDKGPSSTCDKAGGIATGELLGYDSTNTGTPTAVGFYNNKPNSCTFIAGEVQAGSNWQPISVSISASTNVMATGITGSNANLGSGDIVGIATTSGSPGQEGWYVQSDTSGKGKLLTYSYSGSTATAFTGIAKVGTTSKIEVVGWYTVQSTKGVSTTHGLVATPNSSGSGFNVSTIDEPNAVGLTKISGINTLGDICGWYTDSKGVYHGFVGLGIVPALRVHRRQHSGMMKHVQD